MADRRNESGAQEGNDRHLFNLVELDNYKVAPNDPDVRGWSVLDKDRKEIGRIDELIVDPAREKVRYLDVVPNTQRSVDEGDQHMLIPVGAARIDENENKIIVDAIDQDRLSTYPMHRGDYISRDIETQVVEKFNRPGTASRNGADQAEFYEHELYDENRFYAARNKNRKP